MNTIGKKDIHNRSQAYETAYKKLEMDQEIIIENKEYIFKFIRDCRLGKTLRNRQKKSIGIARCLKYIQILKRLSLWLDKPFNDVSQYDMESLIESLENDKYTYQIKSKSGIVLKTGKYAHATKLDYKITLKKFYKWLLGNNVHYPELVDWIETYDIVKEIPALSRDEVEKMAQASKIRDRAIIMLLFDSGARAEEFLNIKLCDLTKIDDIYKVRIVHSKTKPRTIHLPICSKYLDLWLQEYNFESEQDYLFPLTYDGLRMMLHRISKIIGNKTVTPHVLRHSSATYYASHLKHFQLCYRYGWTMSSDMPNRYLDREGMLEEETSLIIKSKDNADLEKQNQILKEDLSHVKNSNDELQKQVADLSIKFENLFQGKDIMKLIVSLADKMNNADRLLVPKLE
jgi:integrase